LCTIRGVVEAIRGIGRVLRPGGKFIFFEHGLSPDPRVQRWQKRSEPIPHWLFEGCHVTRDIPSLITNGGFHIEQIETAYLAPSPKSWTHDHIALPAAFFSVTKNTAQAKPGGTEPTFNTNQALRLPLPIGNSNERTKLWFSAG
jgi:hypothetical protein